MKQRGAEHYMHEEARQNVSESDVLALEDKREMVARTLVIANSGFPPFFTISTSMTGRANPLYLNLVLVCSCFPIKKQGFVRTTSLYKTFVTFFHQRLSAKCWPLL